MNDFIFHNPTKVYFGTEQLAHLGEELATFGTKVLLVYGGGSIKKSGLYDRIHALLADAGLSVTSLGGVEPNPRHTTVNEGAVLCRREGVDVVLAVGGGSTIDCAKAIAATAPSTTDDVWDLIEGRATVGEVLPIVTVLTLAGTGSEMDGSAVISNKPRNLKCSLRTPLVRPRVTFEDPSLTATVPAYQTACGSIDIMSHIFDATYFTDQPQLDMLVRVQEEVLKTVIHFAPIALDDPANLDARANLMWASSWALNDFLFDGVKQQGACHVMEHELSAYYDITHGHGLAILIPRWLRYILDDTTAPLIHRFGVRCLDIDASLAPIAGAEATTCALAHFFFDTLGVAATFTDLGIDERHFADMADHACEHGPIQSIKTLTRDDVIAIYKLCL
ncbi:MAG: iron-containing alcohol dehydrogenase [Peptococcaceae bacterium]|nr:iron-containing alcohol dehydrogenase [Peptococcaceae bacterium]